MRDLEHDDRMLFRRFPAAGSSSPPPGREVPDARAPALLSPYPLHQWFPPGGWEYAVARFLQRVQETRELLREDLQEIAEPLAALRAHRQASSEEQRVLLQVVEDDYHQAMQVIDHTLTQLFRCFPAEVDLLHQALHEHQHGDHLGEEHATAEEGDARNRWDGSDFVAVTPQRR